FTGGSGSDQFVLTGGNDYIYGGTGGSTLDLSQLPSPASLNLASPLEQFLGANDGSVTLVSGSIQKVIAPPSGSFILAGNGNVTLVGGSGSDTLAAGNGTQTLIG